MKILIDGIEYVRKESAKEEPKPAEKKWWRAERNKCYWRLSWDGVKEFRESGDQIDERCWTNHNYFKTLEDAELQREFIEVTMEWMSYKPKDNGYVWFVNINDNVVTTFNDIFFPTFPIIELVVKYSDLLKRYREMLMRHVVG